MSLRTRWTLGLFALLGVPFGLMAGALLWLHQNSLTSAERSLQLSTIAHADRIVTGALGDAARATRAVAAVLASPRASAEAGAKLPAVPAPLAAVALYDIRGARIAVVLREGALPSGPAPASLGPADLAAASEGITWLPPVYSPSGATLLVAMPLANAGGFVLGLLPGDVLSIRLRELAFNLTNDRDDALLVLDPAARVLAGPRAGPLAVGHSLTGRDVLASQHARRDPTVPFGLDARFVSADGQPMVGALLYFPAPAWGIAMRRTTDQAFGAVPVAVRLLGAMALLLLFVVVVLGSRIASLPPSPGDASSRPAAEILSGRVAPLARGSLDG